MMVSNGKDQVSMSEIAKGMKYSTAASTGAVDAMEKLGFVERSHGTADRRHIYVHLTSRGAEALSAILKSLSVN